LPAALDPVAGLVARLTTATPPALLAGPHLVVLPPCPSPLLQLKLNTDESPNVATEYGIRSIPTVMVFKNGGWVGDGLGWLGGELGLCLGRGFFCALPGPLPVALGAYV
jgi:hypothetical protein